MPHVESHRAHWPRAAKRAGMRYIAGLCVMAPCVWAVSGHAAAADRASSVVYEADGLRATAYADCDASAYAVARLTDSGSAERYASNEKFAARIEPHVPAILEASVSWLDSERSGACETPAQAETVALVGVVNALPVYAQAASRTAAWRPGSAAPDARAISMLAQLLPPAETVGCETFEQSVASKIDKYRTRIFTIRAAHTTGQWSHMQALTKLVPLHQEIMSLVGDWAFEWHCAGVFDLAGLAILADEERAALLEWNREKIRERLAGASTPDEISAVMIETYRSQALPPVSSLHDISRDKTLRYGGFLSPEVEETEALFGGAAD